MGPQFKAPERTRRARSSVAPRAAADPSSSAPTPALFKMTGCAHHPYASAAGEPRSQPGLITRLQPGHDGARPEQHLPRLRAPAARSGVPLYLTEWDGALQDQPPGPVLLAPRSSSRRAGPTRASTWPGAPPTSGRCASSCSSTAQPNTERQEGQQAVLEHADRRPGLHTGTPKPALQAFRIPIWLPARQARHERHGLGPAAPGQPPQAPGRQDRVPAQRLARRGPCSAQVTDHESRGLRLHPRRDRDAGHGPARLAGRREPCRLQPRGRSRLTARGAAGQRAELGRLAAVAAASSRRTSRSATGSVVVS